MAADMGGFRRARARPGAAADNSRCSQITFPPAWQAPGLARRATREVLAAWRLAHLEEAAILLVSELVTNAVRHAGTGGAPVILRLETTGTWLRIEVHDADARGPQPRTPTGLDESGFGLVLVEAVADKWGVHRTAAGKTVWAELDARQGFPEAT